MLPHPPEGRTSLANRLPEPIAANRRKLGPHIREPHISTLSADRIHSHVLFC